MELKLDRKDNLKELKKKVLILNLVVRVILMSRIKFKVNSLIKRKKSKIIKNLLEDIFLLFKFKLIKNVEDLVIVEILNRDSIN